VTPINTATNTALKAIKAGSAGSYPSAIAITPNGRTAYITSAVTSLAPGTVTPINTATNTAGKAIRVGSGPLYIAITP
jgi:DNA-binding beta-propeller fold protein YncE